VIYITQCKCPHDHCIVAVAWEGEEADTERQEREFKDDLQRVFESKALNPWCGLCLSRDFHYTTHRTVWNTIEEAKPHLLDAQRQQLTTAAILGPLNEAKRKGAN
jgi:hypothetical protein